MEYHIRRSEVSDIDSLGRVHAQAWQETYLGIIPADILQRVGSVESRTAMRRQIFANPKPEKGYFLVEDRQGNVVGFGDCGAAFQVNDFAPAEIYTLYVLRSAQGNGLGRQLLVAMFDHLTAYGFEACALKTHAGNERAKRFYAHMGGVERGEIEDVDWNETVYSWASLNRES